MIINFDPRKHEYTTEDGRRLPSVTEICNLATGDTPVKDIPSDRLKAAMARGTYVHAGTVLFDEGRLAWDEVTEESRPYLEAYRLFRDETGWEIIESETIGGLSTHAGTLDRVFQGDEREILVDLKTGGSQKWHCVQLAGYGTIRGDFATRDYAALYLTRKGTYSILKYTVEEMMTAHGIFMAALRLWWWRDGC